MTLSVRIFHPVTPQAEPTPAPAAAKEQAAPAEQTPVPTEAPTPEPIDYTELYEPALETYRRFLRGEEPDGIDTTARGDYYMVLGDIGISCLSRYGGTLGYCLKDLDGDKVPELLISADGSEYYEDYLYDLFALADGKPQRVLASSDRVRYQLRSDDPIYFEGSGGASNVYFFLYELAYGRLALVDGLVMDGELLFELKGDRQNPYEITEDDVPLTEEEFYALSRDWASLVTGIDIQPIA